MSEAKPLFLAKNGKKNLLSGSTMSGSLTLGNYIGAIRNWDALQEQYNCFYMVADLHAITTRQDPKLMLERATSFYALYIACGLNPNKNSLFMQSHVPEHSQLAWVLNCFAPYGDLTRMTQFKDKSIKNPKNINTGLFTYPVLMAADILLYNTHLVPVGEDQKQHLELTRDIAIRFNNEMGDSFAIPDPYITKVGARIMALLEPERKMDKSDPNPNNTIFLLDEPKAIEKKIKSATTDSGSEIKFADDKAGVSNLLQIHSCLSGKSISDLENHFVGKMYGHLKMEVVELVLQKLKPIQEEHKKLMADQNHLRQMMKQGAEQARATAEPTLRRVYDRIGFIPQI